MAMKAYLNVHTVFPQISTIEGMSALPQICALPQISALPWASTLPLGHKAK